MEKKKPVLSISILISNNRADTIEKCMKALVPLREAVPSELIIVDTGCKDEGIEIARKYADKVVEFTWCNDFAAARNAGLKECTGEWFMYMDDDEWFEDVSDLVAFFQSEERHKYDAVWYKVRNYDNFAGTVYADTYVGRINKLVPESRFYGKIHEWMEPFPTKMQRVKDYAHHYGYVYKNEADRQRHLERNITLEEAAVTERPDDIRMCCQLVQEYRAAERYEDAAAFCKKTLDATEHEITNSFVQYLLITLPKIYKEQKKFDKAIEEFERLEREVQLLHQTKRSLYYEKAMTYAQMGLTEKMQCSCRQYFEECETFPKVGDPVEYEIMDFAHYTSDFSRHKMLDIGITGMLEAKIYDNTEFFFDRLDWGREKPYPFEQLSALLEIYRQTGDGKLLLKYIPKIIVQPELENRLYGSLHNLYASHPENRALLLKDLEATGLRSGNLSYFHLLYLAQEKKLAVADVEEYYEKSDRKYDAEVLVLLLDKPEVLQVALQYITFELYQEGCGMFAKNITAENSESLVDGFTVCEPSYPEEKIGFFLYGKMVLADRLLRLYAAQNQEEDMLADAGRVRDLLWQVAVTNADYCEYLYHPQVLVAEGQPMLPRNCRFGYQVLKAFENEANFAVWAGAIKEGAKICPELLPMLRVLLAEKETQNKQPSPEEELMQLAKTLKASIRAQLAEGKKEEAKALLTELAELLPQDAEVAQLLVEAEA